MNDEEVIKTKGDLGKISERTKILKVDCGLNREDAVNIMKRCRTLQQVVFDYKSFAKTDDDAKEYFGKWVYLDME